MRFPIEARHVRSGMRVWPDRWGPWLDVEQVIPGPRRPGVGIVVILRGEEQAEVKTRPVDVWLGRDHTCWTMQERSESE